MSDSSVFFITGCSSGFGRSLVNACLEQGHQVFATARDVEAIRDLEHAGRCHVSALDVTKKDHICFAVRQAIEVFGRVDVLVNNAGAALLAAVEEGTEAEMRACMELNFWGPLELTRQLLPHMRTAGSGTIVNMSAAAVIENYAGFGIYGAAKAATESLSESLRAETSPHGLRVMLVEPGPFRTDFLNRSLALGSAPLDAYASTRGKFATLLKSIHGKQPGDPELAAKAILEAIATSKPPFRLVLGKYAHSKVHRACAERLKELTEWERVTLPTDLRPQN